jgi:hypothetical protein
MEKEIKYMVCKVLKTVEAVGYNGETKEMNIGNCYGYIPIFDTPEEAEKYTENGKYEIKPIIIG